MKCEACDYIREFDMGRWCEGCSPVGVDMGEDVEGYLTVSTEEG